MTDAFLTPGDVASINRLAEQGFATREAVFGTTSLMLRRYDEINDAYVVLRPQSVVVERANLQEQVVRGPEGQQTVVTGYLNKEGPFDVRPGDTFALMTGSGLLPAVVVTVDLPELGVTRASFRLAES